MTRRSFIAAAASLPALRDMPAAPTASRSIFVGRSDGAGIRRVSTNADATSFGGPVVAAADIDEPSFLALHPTLSVLYAVSEGDAATSALYAFRITQGRALEHLGSALTHSAGPCFIGMHPSGKTAVTANYGGGSLSFFSLANDGRIAERPETFSNHSPASRVVADRQEASHLHCATYAPDGRLLAACDLGTDELLLFDCDVAGRPAGAPVRVAVPPGSGPRHVVFAQNGRTLYCLNELSCTVSIIDLSTDAPPRLRAGEEASTLACDNDPAYTAAELLIDREGRSLVASTRGFDFITTFDIAADGGLSQKQWRDTGGKGPRWIGWLPGQKGLLALNQVTSSACTLRFQEDGWLGYAGNAFSTPNPTCVVFWPREAA